MNEPKTRAAVPPPRKSFLPESAAVVASVPVAANNMKGERLAPMTFNMPREWHTRFKVTAATLGIDMKQLLVESFAAWEREQKARSK
ncbi:MAG: hypothetical protein DI537_13890 [Stutzerimonas stutzeri]|nr:MAG: hypothetical protein DI537_13890 [Stutzerimonas stutzeri]